MAHVSVIQALDTVQGDPTHTAMLQLNYSYFGEAALFGLMSSLCHGQPEGLRPLNTNQQAGHRLVFITLSPLYDSQPWRRDQLPDFSFCFSATDRERL